MKIVRIDYHPSAPDSNLLQWRLHNIAGCKYPVYFVGLNGELIVLRPEENTITKYLAFIEENPAVYYVNEPVTWDIIEEYISYESN